MDTAAGGKARRGGRLTVAPIVACMLEELTDSVPTVRRIGEREIVLIKWHDKVYALRNVCPHMSASWEHGVVTGFATGEVGDFVFDGSAPVIACPWHQFEFALDSGLCVTDPSLRVRSYRTSVENGTVFIDLSERRAAKAAAPGE